MIQKIPLEDGAITFKVLCTREEDQKWHLDFAHRWNTDCNRPIEDGEQGLTMILKMPLIMLMLGVNVPPVAVVLKMVS